MLTRERSPNLWQRYSWKIISMGEGMYSLLEKIYCFGIIVVALRDNKIFILCSNSLHPMMYKTVSHLTEKKSLIWFSKGPFLPFCNLKKIKKQIGTSRRWDWSASFKVFRRSDRVELKNQNHNLKNAVNFDDRYPHNLAVFKAFEMKPLRSLSWGKYKKT